MMLRHAQRVVEPGGRLKITFDVKAGDGREAVEHAHGVFAPVGRIGHRQIVGAADFKTEVLVLDVGADPRMRLGDATELGFPVLSQTAPLIGTCAVCQRVSLELVKFT